MRRRYVASTSLRRHVPAGNLPPPPWPPNILNLPTPMIICSNSFSHYKGDPEENSSYFSNVQPCTITCTLDAFINYIYITPTGQTLHYCPAGA